ncbi:unnamed protein product [Torque teno virus 23]|uniref:Capsid protein n=1 Tax=Torque teno virus 23 TaxID=687362 RepID=Q9DTD4_9VIRU|nr:unnamed protein product [Torque teno virus 23]BAB20602.1 unnamed protein product [Torque teno virus 23]
MARWRRWRRRRPWWWKRRRRRWRRVRPRRARRTVRRRRRRYTVRRRRWGRRRGRLRRTRWRRTRRRRKRKTLILRQWNPATVRSCRIKGLVPMVICGHTRAGRNYAMHSEDYPEQGRYPFGGSLSTTTWSLKVLFDEHQKFHNRWSRSNQDLDLARYLGCRFTFYRDKKTDYIVTYRNKPPFKINKLDSPMSHPGMLMQQKQKIIIPSYDTRPGGPQKITVKIRPPKLFQDKWYTQTDLCEVNLVSFVVSACSLTHPFCPPLTNNPCVTFQVLKDFYYGNLNIAEKTNSKNIFETLKKHPGYYENFLTQTLLLGDVKPAKYNDTNGSLKSTITNASIKTNNNGQFGMYVYDKDKLGAALQKAVEWYHQQYQTHNDVHSIYGKPTNEYLGYHTGIYSPMVLSPMRSNLDMERAFQDVTYNPNADRGKGNIVWFQYSTRNDTTFDEKQYKCVLQDLPIWAALYGYSDFVEAELGISAEIHNSGVIVVVCPTLSTNEKGTIGAQIQGYIFYDTLFGQGEMPDGRGHIPIYWQSRWYPRSSFQQQVIHDPVLSGPFSYKDDLVSTTLTAAYSFKFLWGGDTISEQVVRNPCRADAPAPSYPHRQPRDVQVIDPRLVGPQWVFHTWDWRRGLFGKKAIKRVSQKPDDDEDFTAPYKIPRYFPPPDREGAREEDSASESEDQGSNFIPEEEEALEAGLQGSQLQQHRVQRVYILQQLREQRRMGQQLQHLTRELLKRRRLQYKPRNYFPKLRQRYTCFLHLDPDADALPRKSGKPNTRPAEPSTAPLEPTSTAPLCYPYLPSDVCVKFEPQLQINKAVGVTTWSVSVYKSH